MFRRLWPGLRSPATTNISRRWPRPQSHTSFFTSRTAYRQYGSRNRQPLSKILHAEIYGTIVIAIGLLVTDTSLSLEKRSELAMQTINHVSNAPDAATRLQRYWDTGRSLLERYSGAALEYDAHLRLDQWRDDELEARLMVTPDPDVPGGSFILCQVVLFEEVPSQENRIENQRIHDLMHDLLSGTEAFAQYRGGLARGVLLFMDMDGRWLNIYFDGKRWFNIAYWPFKMAQDLSYEP
ncbi:uncharacterized protein F4817DRAFT_355360 [Daldinia loculata]|uniref:uncharacterized protein n=1 Tax=Daldinia loculata TaxID=103429 RepID=UPI0020C1E31D|nr:uncharacterized protein F4817DRAFT_355360 [Daldinia loculata]KAI1641572.1 hypothetical protein F4817DRAFT_355360 [Daldinia loculata]